MSLLRAALAAGGLLLACACVVSELVLACACNDLIPIYPQPATVSNAASAPTWYGPYPVDLGDVRDPNPDYVSLPAPGTVGAPGFYSYDSRFSPSDAAYPYQQSFAAYAVDSSATTGVLAASFYDGQHFRPFGRVYNPYSRGGSGWSGYGPQATFLDNLTGGLAGIDGFYLTTSLGPSGAGLMVFSDGVTPALAQNVELTTSLAWTKLSSELGTVSGAGIPGKGSIPLASGATGIYANGASTSSAWDPYGHAYASYVNAAAGDVGGGYVRGYNAFSSWSSVARLGPLTAQTQLVSDGYTATAVWTGQDNLVATQLALGTGHGCAVDAASVLRCWGDNTQGQTGSGTSGNTTSYPQTVLGIGAPITQVSAGDQHTCALTRGGDVTCWGLNFEGELGNGTTVTPQSLPSIVVTTPTGMITPVKQVTAGKRFSCALDANRAVWCWGNNVQNQFGNGLGGTSSVPVQVSFAGLVALNGLSAIQVASGATFSCALFVNSVLVPTVTKVACWGENVQGTLGTGDAAAHANPVLLNYTGAGLIRSLAMSPLSYAACLLDSNSAAWCWGINTTGQMGNVAATNPQTSPIQSAAAQGPFTSVSPGASHVCALASSGSVYCWGDNSKGQMGNPALGVGPITPGAAASVPPGVTITQVVSGTNDTCALTRQRTALCWGDNSTAQTNGTLKLAGTTTVTTPTELPASANQALQAAWSVNGFQCPVRLSTGDVKSMSAATDGQGNVVVLYLMVDPHYVAPPAGTVSTQYPIRGNNVRVFASMRGASGTWIGPTPVDDSSLFPSSTTTVYQEAWGRMSGNLLDVTGGIEYFTPGIAYLGGGRFLAAFAMTDLVGSTSSIYVRGYTAGVGWDAPFQTLGVDSMRINRLGNLTEAFRYANELSLVADGQGDALLSAQVVVPSSDGSNPTLRNYGFKAYVYSASSGSITSASGVIPNSVCRAPATLPALPGGGSASYFCWNLKPKGMIFPGGEAVVVFPAPYIGVTNRDAESLRLYTSELHL